MPKLQVALVLRVKGVPPVIISDVEDLGLVRQVLGSAIRAAEHRAERNPQDDQRGRALRRLRDHIGSAEPAQVM